MLKQLMARLWRTLSNPFRSWRQRRRKRQEERTRRDQREAGLWLVVECQELLPELEPTTLYLLGEGGQVWQAVMVCPCGCGETLHMSTLADDWPRWKVQRHEEGTASLSPSVWRKVGCRSHFWLRQGRIDWC